MSTKFVEEQLFLKNQTIDNHFWEDLFAYKSLGYKIRIIPIRPGMVDLDLTRKQCHVGTSDD